MGCGRIRRLWKTVKVDSVTCHVTESTFTEPAVDRVELGEVDGAAGLGAQHAPLDQLLGELRGRAVVDDGQRPQVLLADREHPAVVVAALALDGTGVAREQAGVRRRYQRELLEVEDKARR